MVITLILEALIGIGRLLISFNLLLQILLVFGMRRGNHRIISLLREISVGCQQLDSIVRLLRDIYVPFL